MELLEQFRQIFELSLVEELHRVGKIMEVEEGVTIMEVGQHVTQIPIVLSGILKVSREDKDGNELLLYYVNPQESCAMTFTCCMQQFPSEIKAIAEERLQLLVIPIQYMDHWLAKYPTWKSYVMRTIKERFHELLMTIDQIAFQHLDDRLVHYLKEKSKTTKSTVLNLSHTQVAQDLASSREVVSRLLKKLEIDKKLILYRGQIKLLNAIDSN